MFPVQIHQLKPEHKPVFIKNDHECIKPTEKVRWSKHHQSKVNKLMKHIGRLRKEGLVQFKPIYKQTTEYSTLVIDMQKLSDFMHERVNYIRHVYHKEVKMIIMGRNYYQNYISGVVTDSFYVHMEVYTKNFMGIKILVDPLIDGIVFVREEE